MKKLFIPFVFLLSATVQALPAGWYDAGKVTRVHSGHGGNTIFLFSTEKNLGIDVAGCFNSFGYMVKETGTNSNRIYSLLLTAYTSGKPVAIYLTGSCIETRPEVNAVQITETSYF